MCNTPITIKNLSVFGTKWVNVPCGQCISCRVAHRREWTVRLQHETDMSDRSCFLTLTYNQAELLSPVINYKHAVDWIKRLRDAVAPQRIRYYIAGEYGSKTNRPHFHALIWGLDLSQSASARVYRARKHVLYVVDDYADSRWSAGFVSSGSVTTTSAEYVAKYALKLDPRLRRRRPLCSTHPGIGAAWAVKFRDDWALSGNVVLRGKLLPAPRYYYDLLMRVDPDLYARARHLYLQRAAVTIARDEVLYNYNRFLYEARESVAKARLSLYNSTVL